MKACIITGTSQGLGRCLATRFAAGGADLVLCTRNANELPQLATDLQAQYPNITVFWQRCDMSEPADIARFMQEAISQARQGIGALINNVGAFELNRTDAYTQLLHRDLAPQCVRVTGSYAHPLMGRGYCTTRQNHTARRSCRTHLAVLSIVRPNRSRKYRCAPCIAIA